MTAEARVFVDVDLTVREWCRDSVPLIQRRAFFGVNNAAAFPQVRVWRLGGVDEAARYQFDAWGPGRNLKESLDVALELANAAELVKGYVSDGVRLAGAAVQTIRPLPEEESDRARHIVEVLFAAYPA